MKKMMMMAATVAVSAMALVSCEGGSKASLNDSVDSLAYDLGVGQSESLRQYMMQMGVDTTQMDDFIKGIKEGALNEADPKKEAYLKGLEIGAQVQQMAKGLGYQVYGDDSTKTVKVKNIVAGLIDGLKRKEGTPTPEDAYNSFVKRSQELTNAQLEKKYSDSKKKNEEYLRENAKKEGVKTTKSGLQYKVLVEGDGALPADDAKIQVNYEGKLIDGTVFDSSYTNNTPFVVDMAHPGVIAGWVQVLKMMPAGSKWEVTIPQELGYGPNGNGPIPPFSTLIFTMEVLK